MAHTRSEWLSAGATPEQIDRLVTLGQVIGEVSPPVNPPSIGPVDVPVSAPTPPPVQSNAPVAESPEMTKQYDAIMKTSAPQPNFGGLAQDIKDGVKRLPTPVRMGLEYVARANTAGYLGAGYGDEKPPVDATKEGESNKVVDDIPPNSAQAQAKKSMGTGGGGPSFASQMNGWKGKTQSAFDGYVIDPLEQQKRTAFQKGQLESDQANEAGDTLERQRFVQDAQFKEEQDKEAALNDEFQARIDKLNEASKAISDTNISEKNFWSSRSAGENALMIFASAVNVATKGPSLIDKAIERDLDIQEKNLNNRRAGVNQQVGLLKQYYDVLGDKKQAMAAARIHMKEDAKAELDTMALRQGGDRAKMNARIEADKLDASIAQNRFQLFQAFNPAPKAPTGGGAASQTPPKWDFTTTVTNIPGMPEGTGIQVNSAEEAKELREGAEASRDVAAKIERLKQLRKENYLKLQNPYSKESQEYDGTVAELQLAQKKVSGHGNNDNKSEAKIDKTVVVPDRKSAMYDVTGISNGNAQLDAYGQKLQTNFQNKLRSGGHTIVQVGSMTDPKTGQTVRTGTATSQTTSNYVNPYVNNNKPGKK